MTSKLKEKMDKAAKGQDQKQDQKPDENQAGAGEATGKAQKDQEQTSGTEESPAEKSAADLLDLAPLEDRIVSRVYFALDRRSGIMSMLAPDIKMGLTKELQSIVRAELDADAKLRENADG